MTMRTFVRLTAFWLYLGAVYGALAFLMALAVKQLFDIPSHPHNAALTAISLVTIWYIVSVITLVVVYWRERREASSHQTRC